MIRHRTLMTSPPPDRAELEVAVVAAPVAQAAQPAVSQVANLRAPCKQDAWPEQCACVALVHRPTGSRRNSRLAIRAAGFPAAIRDAVVVEVVQAVNALGIR